MHLARLVFKEWAVDDDVGGNLLAQNGTLLKQDMAKARTEVNLCVEALR